MLPIANDGEREIRFSEGGERAYYVVYVLSGYEPGMYDETAAFRGKIVRALPDANPVVDQLDLNAVFETKPSYRRNARRFRDDDAPIEAPAQVPHHQPRRKRVAAPLAVDGRHEPRQSGPMRPDAHTGVDVSVNQVRVDDLRASAHVVQPPDEPDICRATDA